MTVKQISHFATAQGKLTFVRGEIFDLRCALDRLLKETLQLELACLDIEQELRDGFEAREEEEDGD